ncbi:hypothetical protein [Apibacter sp. HY039]|uniref:hypothetical protein n=1 Tax=Apibacter sp. HY039 TaxID=2501476 RepID=UPI000FEBDB8B|nr:hypothetical protein [Apibacter sp. HY039]
MSNMFNSVGIGKIKSKVDNYIKWKNIPAYFGYAYFLGHANFDFADDLAGITRKGGNYPKAQGTFPKDGFGGFIKFQNSNTLYSVYDAGNFMTG